MNLLALALPLMLACQAAPAMAAPVEERPQLTSPGEQMIGFTLQVEDEAFLQQIAALEMDVAGKMALTMDQVGFETITFLRSTTGETRPPARPGEPSRRAHPGGWADITSNLANAYRFELYANGNLVRWIPETPPQPAKSRGTVENPAVQGTIPGQVAFPLELRFLNGMEYAAVLEARDGYWVLRDITGEGGPVVRALRTVLARVAPEATLGQG